MTDELIPAEKVATNPGIYKYVRLVNNTFRFIDAAAWDLSHASMVAKDEKAISAGTIKVGFRNPRTFSFYGYGSMTLHVEFKNDDEALLENFLGIKYEFEY